MNNQVQLPSIQTLFNSLKQNDTINPINNNVDFNNNNILIFLPNHSNGIETTLVPLPNINKNINPPHYSAPYMYPFTPMSPQPPSSVPETKSTISVSTKSATTRDRNNSNEIKGTVYSKSSSRRIVTAKTIPCKINYEKDGLKIISRKHCRYNLPKDCVTILNDWLMNHLHNPYPTAQEKRDLLIKTGLTKIQLSNWFINQRRRKIFSSYYSMAKSISEEKGGDDLPCGEVKVPLTKRKKLIDRIDELKQLMGEESS